MFGRPDGLSFSPSTGKEFVTDDNVLFLVKSMKVDLSGSHLGTSQRKLSVKGIKSLMWKLMHLCKKSVKKGNLQ